MPYFLVPLSTFTPKQVLLSGGTSSIVHDGEYPSGQRDLVIKFQFLDGPLSCKFQN